MPLSTLVTALGTNAAIANSSPSGLGGVRLVAGFGAGVWDGFIGSADAFSIGVSGTTTTYDFEPAAINVVKLTNGTDNNSAPGVYLPVGSTVTFTYVVTNPGNVPLSGVTVTDDNGTPGNAGDDFVATFVGGDSNANSLLDPGETWTFTASRIATAGQYINVATATGTPPPDGGPPVTATDTDNHFGSIPAINLVKLTNGTDNDTAPGPSCRSAAR